MNLTVAELRKMNKTLGGDEAYITDNMTIPDALAVVNVSLATFVTAATAKELPEVTAANAGAVLKVGEDGKWGLGTDEINA